jgi:diguanylate cyclase (GGDEF)-like protein
MDEVDAAARRHSDRVDSSAHTMPLGAGGLPVGAPGPNGPMPGAPGPRPGGPDAPGLAAPGPTSGVPLVDATSGALTMPGFAPAYAQAIMSQRYEHLALWYLDIRNFRSVNPKFGFLGGNKVLTAIVRGIRETICHDLPITRLGADRFVVLSATADFDEAQAVFERATKIISQRILDIGIDYQPALCGGVYFLDDEDLHNPGYQRALDYVSIAHRNARAQTSGGLARFTDEDLARDRRRIIIEQSIDEALHTGQIQAWYQPQIDYMYGEVIGAEALARWNHPALGWISPAEFIPALERCGKIHDLDLFIWEEAARNAGRWHNSPDAKPVPISVNVSRMELLQPGLMQHFLDLQDKYDIPDGALRLEVTESAFVEEADRLCTIIETMRSHNLKVEMDDFGSGLSSLNMLKDVPVDVVKLDMGFIRSSGNEARGGVVLGSVIRMLQGLDTPIIAEGVETLEQAEMLKNMGCHLMQGFHFSRPMPLADFEEFVASSNTVEESFRRSRKDSRLDELTSIDPASSYIFNHAIGGMLYFFVGDSSSESILANDAFYDECGLDRAVFGDSKINPILEIDEESRADLWRAASEARENGTAYCHGVVTKTGRWFEAIMRFLGTSSRGNIFSLNILRSGDRPDEATQKRMRDALEADWTFTLLDRISDNGFVKCLMDDQLRFDYASPRLVSMSGMTAEEFQRRFHGSFLELVVHNDRNKLMEALREGQATGEMIECDFVCHHGMEKVRQVHMLGRVTRDDNDTPWLYALLMMRDVLSDDDMAKRTQRDVMIPFDYFFDEDRLVIYSQQTGMTARDVVFENWLSKVELLRNNISRASATRVIAMVHDLSNHPASGFTDIKCNLRGGDAMRWYHINYSCEAANDGHATVLHGFAQDADDRMGSARWWRRQAEIDQLTNLLNRNAAEQEINLSLRTHGSGIFFMVDLDGFKRVNDYFGHIVGDTLLHDVAEALSAHFREGDVLGRYGGDEFVAFVPCDMEVAPELALRRSQELIDAVGALEIPDGTHAACSVGTCICSTREATFYDMLEAADQAMYASKMAGKGSYSVVDI